jgi:hypothetical protein
LEKRWISAYAETPAFLTYPHSGKKCYKESIMANRKMVLGIAVLVMAMVSACSKYADEKDFKVEPVEGGKGVQITKYVGDKFEVHIPPKIQKLPVTKIDDKAFRSGKVTSITIPNSVTSIGRYAFSGCSSLTNVTIPDSVTSIGDSAFYNCESLTSVTIPGSVTSMEGDAFGNCANLTSVTFKGTISSDNFATGDYSPFDGDLRTKYLAGGKGTYTRPNSGSETWTKK